MIEETKTRIKQCKKEVQQCEEWINKYESDLQGYEKTNDKGTVFSMLYVMMMNYSDIHLKIMQTF